MVILIIVLLKSEKNRRKAEKLSCILVEAFESINELDQEEQEIMLKGLHYILF